MKNPLRYQMSEYDCGPTTLLNGISYLFEREEIPPELIRNVMLFCLDCYGSDGISGKNGTSRTAMLFLSNWLNSFGQAGRLTVSSSYLSGEKVWMGTDSRIYDVLRRKGAAVVRLFFDVEHYVLLTGVEENRVYMFDPYYMDPEVPYAPEDILCTQEHPFSYNRIVPFSYLNQENGELYSLGPVKDREAVLLFNETSVLTPEKTIEYFI